MSSLKPNEKKVHESNPKLVYNLAYGGLYLVYRLASDWAGERLFRLLSGNWGMSLNKTENR